MSTGQIELSGIVDDLIESDEDQDLLLDQVNLNDHLQDNFKVLLSTPILVGKHAPALGGESTGIPMSR